MKKYLFAGLAGFISLFLGLFICFGLFGNADAGIAKFLECLIVAFVATSAGYVYKKSDKSAGEKNSVCKLSKSDRKGFQEAFSKMNTPEFGLEEVFVANGKEGISDFVIGIRTSENAKPDFEKIKAILYKTFYPQIKFVFINMNEMGQESKSIFAGGTKIR
ncbi:MAG TPA: hypothetical protein VFJ43_03180 [Bacteroidia bacterium]|nr:hypothetical protein [Bacteroidia bacterium]